MKLNDCITETIKNNICTSENWTKKIMHLHMEEQMFSLSSRSPVCFWPAREKVMAVKEGVFSSFHSHFLHSAAWMVNLLIKPSVLCVSAVSCWQTRSYTKKERGEDEWTNERLPLPKPNCDQHISGRRICPCSSLHQEELEVPPSEFSGWRQGKLWYDEKEIDATETWHSVCDWD